MPGLHKAERAVLKILSYILDDRSWQVGGGYCAGSGYEVPLLDLSTGVGSGERSVPLIFCNNWPSSISIEGRCMGEHYPLLAQGIHKRTKAFG